MTLKVQASIYLSTCIYVEDRENNKSLSLSQSVIKKLNHQMKKETNHNVKQQAETLSIY